MSDFSGLRVLHVVPAAPSGGPPSFTRAQIDRLNEAGVVGQEFVFPGATFLRNPRRLPGTFCDLRRAIRSFRPAIVHAHWGSLLALATVLASRRGPSVVVTFRGSDLNPVPDENPLLRIVRTLCSQFAALRASAVICVSAELRNRLWRGAESAAVILDGTDLRLFRKQDRELARRQLGWEPRAPVVLFNAGNRPVTKRLDLAQAASGHAKAQVPELRFEILNGEVPHRRLPTFLCAADCLLMTSDYEGSPNIVREALACGTPVVSVAVGDVHRWLTGLPGTRVVSRDPTSIGDAIVEVLRDGVRPNASDRALDFSDIRSRDEVLKVYAKALSEKDRVPTTGKNGFSQPDASGLKREAVE